jgi:hypothetical protein
MTRPGPHRCTPSCICPVHRTRLLYSAAVDDHACQDAECVYADGMNPPTTWTCTNQITAIDRETGDPYERECGYAVNIAYPPDLPANRDLHLVDCPPGRSS